MKTKNVSNLLSVIALTAAFSTTANAQKDVAYLQPQGCEIGKNIKFPSGVNAQLYMSEDCKTAFVLPGELTQLSLDTMSLTSVVDEKTCAAVEQRHQVAVVMGKELETLTNQRNELIEIRNLALREKGANYSEIMNAYKIAIDEANEAITNLKEERKEVVALKPFSSWRGLAMNISLKLGVEEDVNKLIDLNKDLGINFKAAKIGNGIISFSTSRDIPGIDLDDILGVKIPGLTLKGQDKFADLDHKMANGGLVGTIALSQPAACALVKNAQAPGSERFDKNLLKVEDLSAAGFVANYTYDVPVSTKVSFSFKAAISAEDLITDFESFKTKERYSEKEMSTLLLQGKLNSSVKVEFDNGGLSQDMNQLVLQNSAALNSEDGNIFNTLFATGMDLFMDAVTNKLTSTNHILAQTLVAAEAPEATQDVRVTRTKHCTRKRSWYGKSKKSCSTTTTQEIVYIPGVGVANRTTKDTSVVAVDLEVKANQTIAMVHTSGFVQKKAGK